VQELDAKEPAITVRDLSMTFPGQRVLDQVSLGVGAGEVHALLGENGSGKSTLIRILAGYHTPDPGGAIFIGSERLTIGSPPASERAGLRFVHQHLAVIGEFNAIENVALEAGYTRRAMIDWKAQERYTRELLSRLHIDMDVRRPLRDCKPVERSAVAIARALRNAGEDPVRALILDEPTASLPAAEVAQLFQVIHELTGSGIAVVYVTHRLDEVFEIADRVSVLRDGRMQGTQSTASLSREGLIEMIVGGQLVDARESRTLVESRPAPAEVRLQVSDLSAGRLAGLSLSVGAGEVLGVVGIAGSGREDVARAVVGALAARSGTVTVAGKHLQPLSPRAARQQGLALCLSNTHAGSAIREFTVQENITLASLGRYRSWGRISRRREGQDARRWADALDIRPRQPERMYRLLSGGNQQKVILGKWLSAGPSVLVLDEPTAGVDVGARQAIYELVAKEAARGLAVLLCSSDLEDIVSMCRRALVLRAGRVVAELADAEVTEHNLLLRSVGEAAPAGAPQPRSTPVASPSSEGAGVR
jgi:ribose transport system ATP-binding protein